MKYPIELTPDDNETLLITCPDLPEVTTCGADADDAVRRVTDAIEEALAARIAHRQDIPAPSRADGRPVATLPPLTVAKVELYRTARERGVTKAELGRRLLWSGPQIDRLYDLRHSSKIENIDLALRALGKQLEITVTDPT